jgi:hypothetical protein
VGAVGRCRVDFDTSAGDETYTLLKSSTEFMQKFVSALCYAMVPGLLEQRQSEMMKVAQARAELQALLQAERDNDSDDDEDEADATTTTTAAASPDRKTELMNILKAGGRDTTKPLWEGPAVRVYFPDEGSAALARRDWNPTGPPEQALVPPCVQFSSCGGVQVQDISNDVRPF